MAGRVSLSITGAFLLVWGKCTFRAKSGGFSVPNHLRQAFAADQVSRDPRDGNK
jgi:hypothetical protein